jgi:hypothetical protein
MDRVDPGFGKVTVPPKRPAPTFKEIIGSIKRIVDEGTGPKQKQEQAPKPRRGLSPGLLLMAIVALAITIAAAVKNMK